MASKQLSDTQLERTTASWPSRIKNNYKAVKLLGKGGFGSVVLVESTNSSSSEGDARPPSKRAAIKVIRKDPKFGFDYAKREMDILRALPLHPNVMKLYDSAMTKHVALLVMEYCPGRSLNSILKAYGAPNSIAFCRVVSAQLVDAIAWLHSYSTLHRDVQPANIMVRGFDEETADTKDDGTTPESDGILDLTYWNKLLAKFHITLIDFGFARALQPHDLKGCKQMRRHTSSFQTLSSSLHKKDRTAGPALNDPMTDSQRRRKHRASSAYVEKDALSKSILTRSTSSRVGDSSGGGSVSSKDRKLNKSASKFLVRSLSALGHRDYAAPEIRKGIHHHEPQKSAESTAPMSTSGMDHTLADYVSDYGMVADAFSVGATIRYLMTGVPPDQSVSETIAAHRSPVARAGRWMQRKIAGGKSSGTEGASRAKKKPKKQYRSDLPPEVVRLVKGLTQGSPANRTTVRAARLYPWIDDVLPLHHENHNHEQNGRTSGGARRGEHFVSRPTKFLDFGTTSTSTNHPTSSPISVMEA